MIVIDELFKGSLCLGLKWVWEGGVILFLWDLRYIFDNFIMKRYNIYFFYGEDEYFCFFFRFLYVL